LRFTGDFPEWEDIKLSSSKGPGKRTRLPVSRKDTKNAKVIPGIKPRDEESSFFDILLTLAILAPWRDIGPTEDSIHALPFPRYSIGNKIIIMIARWYQRCSMPGLLIKDIPREVHAWLKREAKRNRRSMTQQAIYVLEERMRRFRRLKFPPPARTRIPLTAEFIDHAKR
jgi:hypothetical protein